MKYTTFSLRKYKGKKLLSFIRECDYAHAGAQEAIDITFYPIEKDQNREILDVGCGLGETANYIQNNGWGKVTGIDIEQSSIDHASLKFNQCKFTKCDAMYCHNLFKKKKFDIICMFNSFYAFHDQEKFLNSIRKIANKDTKLIIFEYADLTENEKINELYREGNEHITPFKPIKVCNMYSTFSTCGWEIETYRKIHNEYERWYTKLLKNSENKKNKIIKKFGNQAYITAHSTYSKFVKFINQKLFGGIIIYAKIKL